MPADVPFLETLVVRSPSGARSTAGRAESTPPGRVAHQYGPNVQVYVGGESDAAPQSENDLQALDLSGFTPTEKLGIAAVQLRQSPEFLAAKANRPRQGEQWDMKGRCREDSGPTRLAAEAGAPGNSDYLEGTVAVGIVIVNGPTAALQFTPLERTKVIAEVQAGLSYLAGANPAANVTFLYDIQQPQINVPANNNLPEDDREAHWRDPALAVMGVANTAAYIQKIQSQLKTKWTYAAFFTKYPVRHFGYANSERIVMQYANDGWGPDNIDRVFAHETGHVFGAPDEYKDSKCSCGGAHGRFGDPNDNCESCGPGEICLMKKNDFTMCRHTYRHLGWVSPVRTVKTGWVTSISVRPDRLDAFVVDGDGRVRNAFWQPDMPEWFQGWVDVLGGRAKPGAPVTAVSRSEGYLDLFVIGTDRQVWTAARDTAGRWGGWWPIPGVTVPPGCQVGAVSRSRDLLDIFVTDDLGRTMTASWAPWHEDGWRGWWHIQGGSAIKGAAITPVSRRENELDIFVTGTDGKIYNAWWSPTHADGAWGGWAPVLDAVFPQGAWVGAVSRSHDLIDIFATADGGEILTAAWAPTNPGQQWTGWHHIRGGMAKPGTSIYPISRNENHLDVFTTGTDGITYTAAWAPHQPNGWEGWRSINGGQADPKGPITGVSRSKDVLDIFVLAKDRRPWTAGWAPHNPDNAWGGWWAIGP